MMRAEESVHSRDTLIPVGDGSLVEVRGRLFKGADGNLYVRPRLHPGEPDTDPQEQIQLDSTEHRLRITGVDVVDHHLGLQEGPWRTIRGTLNGLTLEADAVLNRPDEWHDTWEAPSPTGQDSGPDAPPRWLLDSAREGFLERILSPIRTRKDFPPHISLGLSGNAEGTFGVSVFMLAINEQFASWASNFSHSDLAVQSFIRAQPPNRR